MISSSLSSLVALALPALLFVPLAFAQSPGALRSPQHEISLLAEEAEEDRVWRARRRLGGDRGAAMFVAHERRTLDLSATGPLAATGLRNAAAFWPQEPSANST